MCVPLLNNRVMIIETKISLECNKEIEKELDEFLISYEMAIELEQNESLVIDKKITMNKDLTW